LRAFGKGLERQVLADGSELRLIGFATLRGFGNDGDSSHLVLTLPAISVSWPQPRVDGITEEDVK
jgi:hypothetical protein